MQMKNAIYKMSKKMRDKININFVIALFIVLSLVVIDKPGLYLDAVNPDYMGLNIFHSANVPEWAYSDNILATLIEGNEEYSHFPLLTSLYGTCFEMYFTLIWSFLFGYGVFSLRTLHILYLIIILLGVYTFLKYLLEDELKATVVVFFLAIEPSFLFSSRTQFYIQLFPYVFFSLGLMCIIKSLNCENLQSIKKYLFVGGVLLGLSASSYFIFAFYFASIFIVNLFLLVKQKQNWLKRSIKLVIGFVVGYIPYIYAHISIILSQGIDGWINALKGLETYGLSDGIEASLGDRLKHVLDCFGNIAGGNSIIYMMTEHKMGLIYGKIFAATYFIFVIIAIFLLIKNRKQIIKSKVMQGLLFIIGILLFHLAFALVVGNALGYQHFVMLLPIMVITISLVIIQIVEEKYKVTNIINEAFLGIVTLLMFLYMVVSLERVYEGYCNIKKTGGVAYYSDSINNMSYYLDGVVTENDIIVSPQWGYWMQIACITNGEKMIWIDTSKDILQWRIDNNCKTGKYYIIIDNNTDAEMITNLMVENGYILEKTEKFNDWGESISPIVNVYRREG